MTNHTTETKTMTNAIEQTKREMYRNLELIKVSLKKGFKPVNGMHHFEIALEAHLEELRKLMVLTSTQQGEEVVSLRMRLSAMTQDRDDCQKRMQALDHAHFNLDQANKVAGEELRKAQEQARRDRQDCIESEKLSDSLDERLRDAQAVIGHQEQLIAGQRLAIADLYLAKHRAPKPEEATEAPCANTMAILGAVVDCQQIVSDWAVYGHKAKGAMKKLADVLNGTPELTEAMKSFEKADGCMHSFHPAFPGGEQCIFCGESRE